uniref:Uncharacterized protein n=1 Tax=Romanomermis culicivorax TaxID=13658 RepID=A0A915JRR9_ROMCU
MYNQIENGNDWTDQGGNNVEIENEMENKNKTILAQKANFLIKENIEKTWTENISRDTYGSQSGAQI